MQNNIKITFCKNYDIMNDRCIYNLDCSKNNCDLTIDDRRIYYLKKEVRKLFNIPGNKWSIMMSIVGKFDEYFTCVTKDMRKKYNIPRCVHEVIMAHNLKAFEKATIEFWR